LVASTLRHPYTVIFWDKIQNFRFVNGRPSPDCIYLVSSLDGGEYVVQFADVDEKEGIIRPYRDLVRRLADTTFPAGPRAPNIGKWFDIEVPETVPALMNHAGCFHNGSAYFFGGTTALLADFDLLLKYDLAASQWHILKGDPPARSFHTLTTCNNGLYLAFGCQNASTLLSDIWHFDPGSVGWRQIVPKGEKIAKRMCHSCIAVGTALYFFGGRGENGQLLNDLIIFDTNTGNLVCHPKLQGAPCPRFRHSAAYLPATHEMVIIGGQNDAQILGDVHVLSLSKLKWRSESSANQTERVGHQSLPVLGKWLLTFGGEITNGGDAVMAVIELETWMEHLVQEWGNRPWELTSFGFAETGPGKMITFGGSPSAWGTPFPAAYLFEFEGGSVARSRPDPPIFVRFTTAGSAGAPVSPSAVGPAQSQTFRPAKAS
jgi:hypothetical protein